MPHLWVNGKICGLYCDGATTNKSSVVGVAGPRSMAFTLRSIIPTLKLKSKAGNNPHLKDSVLHCLEARHDKSSF